MDRPPLLADLLLDAAAPHPAGGGLWSVLPPDEPGQRYDRRAAAYDRVVGSGLYNRLLWGSSPRAYAAFATRAVRAGTGPLLDAGCGSLVFTAAAYARTDRPLVLVDRSLGMLAAARDRLAATGGYRPDRVVLLQADLLHLPFRAAAFGTVLCMGMLHLFDDPAPVAAELARVAGPDGAVFMTSLLAERAVGRRYLSLLHRAGEVAAPRTQAALLAALAAPLPGPVVCEREGSMGFIVAGTRPPE